MKKINKEFINHIGAIATLYEEIQNSMYKAICELDEDEITPFFSNLKKFYEEREYYTQNQIDTFKLIYWRRMTDIELRAAAGIKE